MNSKAHTSFEVESGHWSIFNKREILIENILSENNIDCKNVSSLFIEIKRDFLDILLGPIPFFTYQTIKIKGNINSFKEEGLAKD